MSYSPKYALLTQKLQVKAFSAQSKHQATLTISVMPLRTRAQGSDAARSVTHTVLAHKTRGWINRQNTWHAPVYYEVIPLTHKGRCAGAHTLRIQPWSVILLSLLTGTLVQTSISIITQITPRCGHSAHALRPISGFASSIRPQTTGGSDADASWRLMDNAVIAAARTQLQKATFVYHQYTPWYTLCEWKTTCLRNYFFHKVTPESCHA